MRLEKFSPEVYAQILRNLCTRDLISMSQYSELFLVQVESLCLAAGALNIADFEARASKLHEAFQYCSLTGRSLAFFEDFSQGGPSNNDAEKISYRRQLLIKNKIFTEAQANALEEKLGDLRSFNSYYHPLYGIYAGILLINGFVNPDFILEKSDQYLVFMLGINADASRIDPICLIKSLYFGFFTINDIFKMRLGQLDYILNAKGLKALTQKLISPDVLASLSEDHLKLLFYTDTGCSVLTEGLLQGEQLRDLSLQCLVFISFKQGKSALLEKLVDVETLKQAKSDQHIRLLSIPQYLDLIRQDLISAQQLLATKFVEELLELSTLSERERLMSTLLGSKLITAEQLEAIPTSGHFMALVKSADYLARMKNFSFAKAIQFISPQMLEQYIMSDGVFIAEGKLIHPEGDFPAGNIPKMDKWRVFYILFFIREQKLDPKQVVTLSLEKLNTLASDECSRAVRDDVCTLEDIINMDEAHCQCLLSENFDDVEEALKEKLISPAQFNAMPIDKCKTIFHSEKALLVLREKLVSADQFAKLNDKQLSMVLSNAGFALLREELITCETILGMTDGFFLFTNLRGREAFREELITAEQANQLGDQKLLNVLYGEKDWKAALADILRENAEASYAGLGSSN